MNKTRMIILATTVIIVAMIVFMRRRALAVPKETPQGTHGGSEGSELCDLFGYFIQENGKTYKVWKDLGKANKLEVYLYDQGYNAAGPQSIEITEEQYDAGKASAYAPDYDWYRRDLKEYCP